MIHKTEKSHTTKTAWHDFNYLSAIFIHITLTVVILSSVCILYKLGTISYQVVKGQDYGKL